MRSAIIELINLWKVLGSENKEDLQLRRAKRRELSKKSSRFSN